MPIFDSMNDAVENRDADAYLDLFAEDAVFVRHQTGTQMTKSDFGNMIRKMTASDDMNMGSRRKIYENDDILVVHSINEYPDGTREAVLMACLLADGKITRVETGATLLPV